MGRAAVRRPKQTPVGRGNELGNEVKKLVKLGAGPTNQIAIATGVCAQAQIPTANQKATRSLTQIGRIKRPTGDAVPRCNSRKDFKLRQKIMADDAFS